MNSEKDAVLNTHLAPNITHNVETTFHFIMHTCLNRRTVVLIILRRTEKNKNRACILRLHIAVLAKKPCYVRVSES